MRKKAKHKYFNWSPFFNRPLSPTVFSPHFVLCPPIAKFFNDTHSPKITLYESKINPLHCSLKFKHEWRTVHTLQHTEPCWLCTCTSHGSMFLSNTWCDVIALLSELLLWRERWEGLGRPLNCWASIADFSPLYFLSCGPQCIRLPQPTRAVDAIMIPDT